MTYAYEYPTYYEIIVTDGTPENSIVQTFSKDQDIKVSIRETELLATHEIAMKQAPKSVII